MRTLCLLAFLSLATGLGAATADYHQHILDSEPVAYWKIDQPGILVRNFAPGPEAASLDGTVEGDLKWDQPAQDPALYPDFPPERRAASFGPGQGFIRIKDPGLASPLDFELGQTITIEGWIVLRTLLAGQNSYVIGKGRTGTLPNQNWALRVREQSGTGCLSFLFRSAGERSQWHRWTSDPGFAPHSGWHHIAVSYTFGEANSLRGYIDGVEVEGSWDMGGRTDAPPVVDDAEVWIGSSMQGNPNSTFHGLINEIALHRRALSTTEIKGRFQFIAPPPPPRPELPANAVLVELIENLGAKAKSWDFTPPPPVETYLASAFGFAEVPQKYSTKGVRVDRSSPFLLRASAVIQLPPGEHQFLLRSLQSARLFIDDRQLAATPFISGRTDGHGEVAPMPTNLPSGLRFARMGHKEQWATLQSDGQPHTVVLEAMIGGNNLRPDVGELSVTVRNSDSSFTLLAPRVTVPHTDGGWTAYVEDQRHQIDQQNANQRKAVAAAETSYWDERHQHARHVADALPSLAIPRPGLPIHDTIDRFIGARLETAGVAPAPLTDDYAFLRRLALDTIGIPPTPEQLSEFLGDPSPQRRERAVDRFLEHPGWADHWVSYWQDVLAENPGMLKPTLNNTGPFRWWIHESFQDNKPLDQFATELIMMEGSVYGGGPAGFGLATQNDVPMADRAQVLSSAFMAMNLACARCHDAPYHDFRQEQLFSLAAMLKRGPQEVPSTSSIPGDAHIRVGRLVEVTLEPGAKVEPSWPFDPPDSEALPELHSSVDPRERLAAHLTDPRRTRFPKVMANRLWKRYLGQGLVEPVDDWETAHPSHPELLEWLGRELVLHDYDFKHVARLILNSHAYQRAAGLVIPVSQEPEDRLFASPMRRRLTAEQVVDSLFAVVGKKPDTEMLTLDADAKRAPKDFLNLGYAKRAWQFTGFANDRDRPALSMPKGQAVIDVLAVFGWRDTRQSPLSSRDHSPNVLQPAALANGDLANGRLARLSDHSEITQLCLQHQPLSTLIEELFLRVFSRPPTTEEQALFIDQLKPGYEERIRPAQPDSSQPDYDRTLQLSWSNHLNAEATEIKLIAEKKAKEGDPATSRLHPAWREQMEDGLWALLNSPEFVFAP